MNNILKVEFYDEFNCIADRCSFTCCEGWQIIIDTDTYNKWNSNKNQSKYFSKNVRLKKRTEEAEHYLKMGPQMHCPFLDEKGLCNIVIKFGEDYLSKTCKIFPRQENRLGEVNEHSLSCACPAVVDILNKRNGKINFLYEGDISSYESYGEAYKIKEVMLKVLQNSRVPFRDKILLSFHILLSLKKELIITNEIINKYEDDESLISLISIWNEIEIDYEDSCQEKNELFLDIGQNYRKEKNFSKYLIDLSEYAENLDIENTQAQWDKFKVEFKQYEKLFENCIVSKVFANCCSDDIDELVMSFQEIITEYVMVEHTSFLKWLMDKQKEINYCDIRDYIVIYSRIIGYNAEGIKEFWEDSFDDAVWDFGYMLLLLR
ncbi:MAG: hypothetical protein K0S01_3971 [Herbinix sp.]|jgi:lysine-N-methylase|nr:hypothetical protein [Herbinix sp.]